MGPVYTGVYTRLPFVARLQMLTGQRSGFWVAPLVASRCRTRILLLPELLQQGDFRQGVHGRGSPWLRELGEQPYPIRAHLPRECFARALSAGQAILLDAPPVA